MTIMTLKISPVFVPYIVVQSAIELIFFFVTIRTIEIIHVNTIDPSAFQDFTVCENTI